MINAVERYWLIYFYFPMGNERKLDSPSDDAPPGSMELAWVIYGTEGTGNKEKKGH